MHKNNQNYTQLQQVYSKYSNGFGAVFNNMQC